MLFSKSFFALVAAASMVAASPVGRAADATVTCTVTVTTSPPLPSIVGTLVAYLADTAIAATLATGSTVTASSSVTDSDGTFTFTITADDPSVPDVSTLVDELDGTTLDLTLGPVTLDVAVSDCS